ncbi:hypothetical protein DBO93_02755 [Colwellia sp. Arc7-D]|nr:hypothetical protein DBO93_02755 [Colwellia sp. Arc7-D]
MASSCPKAQLIPNDGKGTKTDIRLCLSNSSDKAGIKLIGKSCIKRSIDNKNEHKGCFLTAMCRFILQYALTLLHNKSNELILL